jgi:hypothetical protein
MYPPKNQVRVKVKKPVWVKNWVRARVKMPGWVRARETA